MSIGSAKHVHVKEEEWEVVYREIIDGKESGDHFVRTSLGDRSVRKESAKCILAAPTHRYNRGVSSD